MFYRLRKNRVEKALREGRKVKTSDIISFIADERNHSELDLCFKAVDDPAELLEIDAAIGTKDTRYMTAFVKKAAEFVKRDPSLLPKFSGAINRYNDREYQARHTHFLSNHTDQWGTPSEIGKPADCHTDTSDRLDYGEGDLNGNHPVITDGPKPFKPVFKDKD